jgi:hypothetical protein
MVNFGFRGVGALGVEGLGVPGRGSPWAACSARESAVFFERPRRSASRFLLTPIFGSVDRALTRSLGFRNAKLAA